MKTVPRASGWLGLTSQLGGGAPFREGVRCDADWDRRQGGYVGDVGVACANRHDLPLLSDHLHESSNAA